MSNLIGVSGKKQSGKDAIGKIIQYLTTDKYASDLFTKGANEKSEVSWEQYTKYGWDKGDSPWQIKKFATKIKQILSLLTGIPVEDFEKEEVKNMQLGEQWWFYQSSFMETTLDIIPYTKENNHNGLYCAPEDYTFVKPTIRYLLQIIGTDLFRDKFHPNCWVNALFSEYPSDLYQQSHVLCTEAGMTLKELRIGLSKPYNRKEHTTLVNKIYYEKGFTKKQYKSIHWIITDLRFKNECQAIKDRKGILIRVERDTELRFPKLWKEFTKHNSHHDEWEGFLKEKGLFDSIYHESETALDNYKHFDYVINNNSDIPSLILKIEDMLKKEKLL